MTPIIPPDDADRTTIVSLCLRQCALIVDPKNGHLTKLAEHLDLHPVTLSKWLSDGRVPRKSAKRLARVFGKKFVNVDLLVGYGDE